MAGPKLPPRKPSQPAAAPSGKRWLLGDDGDPTTYEEKFAAQQELQRAGYSVGAKGPDGDWGPTSRQSYAAFRQKSRPVNTQPAFAKQAMSPAPSVAPTTVPLPASPAQRALATNPAAIPPTSPGIPAGVMANRRSATPVAPVAAAPPALPMRSATTGSGAPAPQTTAGRILSTTGGAIAGGAGAVGTAIKNDPMGALNATLGVAGLVMNATAKKPKLPAAMDFSPSLRPAQGMSESSVQKMRDNVDVSRRNATVVGRDQNLNTAARLQANATASSQLNEVEGRNAEVYRADENRLGEQQNRVQELNFQNRVRRQDQQYESDQRGYETQKAQGTAMAQGALTYFAQDRAANKAASTARIDGQGRLLNQEYSALATKANRTVADELRMKEIRKLQGTMLDDPGKKKVATNAQGGKLVLRKGGKLTRETTTVRTGTPASVQQAQARAQQQFLSGLQSITLQAMRSFAAVIGQNTKINSAPLR